MDAASDTSCFHLLVGAARSIAAPPVMMPGNSAVPEPDSWLQCVHGSWTLLLV